MQLTKYLSSKVKLLSFPFVLLMITFLAGCASHQRPVSTVSHAETGSVKQDFEEVLPDPNDRPGLATGWGESIASGIYEVDFHRAGEGKPMVVQQFYYNDLKGIIAQAGKERDRDYGRVDFADGDLEFGLKKPKSGYYSAYHSDGDIYFRGTKGERYILEVKNNLSRRVEVVISVDGLDVINGRPASVKNAGYIIEPKDKIRIHGFRKSKYDVAAFRFSGVADSYAQQKYGDARNVGVIGVAAFPEVIVEREIRQKAEPFPSKYATPPLGQAKR